MPLMEIIRHKTFAVVRKTAKSVKVSWYTVDIMYIIMWLIIFIVD